MLEQMNNLNAVKSSCNGLELRCSLSAWSQSGFLVQSIADHDAAVNSNHSLAHIGTAPP